MQVPRQSIGVSRSEAVVAALLFKRRRVRSPEFSEAAGGAIRETAGVAVAWWRGLDLVPFLVFFKEVLFRSV